MHHGKQKAFDPNTECQLHHLYNKSIIYYFVWENISLLYCVISLANQPTLVQSTCLSEKWTLTRKNESSCLQATSQRMHNVRVIWTNIRKISLTEQTGIALKQQHKRIMHHSLGFQTLTYLSVFETQLCQTFYRFYVI